MSVWDWFRRKPEQKASAAGRAIAWVHAGKPVWMPRRPESFLKEGYQQNSVGYACIRYRAWTAAAVSWCLYKGESELDEHPLLDLIEKPNPLQGKTEFFADFYESFFATGNGFMESVGPNVGPPIELYVQKPQLMKILAGPLAIPMAYRLEVGSEKKDWPCDPITGESDIWHLKTWHPFDHWYGMSPMEAAAYAIDQHNSAGAWNQSLLQNAARPSGALVLTGKDGPANLTDEQFTRLKQQLKEQQTDADAKGAPLLLDGGMDWKEMSMSPKDMDFLEGKLGSAREICAVYGLSPMLVGIPGEATFANFESAKLAFWEDSQLPFLDVVRDALNRWLVPRFGEDLRLDYDEDSISALAPRRKEKFEMLVKADFLSINEKREALGYEPTEGGDDVMVPSTSLPASFGGIPPEPPAADPKKAGKLAYGE
jgi:HK97 family phage portal protein